MDAQPIRRRNSRQRREAMTDEQRQLEIEQFEIDIKAVPGILRKLGYSHSAEAVEFVLREVVDRRDQAEQQVERLRRALEFTLKELQSLQTAAALAGLPPQAWAG